jgi:hypothetical protein
MVDESTSTYGNIGFLSVLQEPSGYVGGYLVTNSWGRPLEFRLSSAVQPNRVQQALYGESMAGYVCGDLIGKTLIEKTSTSAPWVVTDNPLLLDLRLRLPFPLALWQTGGPDSHGLFVQPNLFCHKHFPEDVAQVRGFAEKLGTLDLGEPFARIREALSEARKMGIAARPA